MKFIWLALLSSFSTLVSANTCPSTGAWLQVLGSGGPEVQDQRASSSYLIWIDGKAKVLIDAGGGSALRFGESGATMSDIDVVLFSHLHIDHSADFPALIKSSFFESRQRDLLVYGPTGNQFLPSTEDFVQRLFSKQGVWPYLNDFLPGESSFGYDIKAQNVTVDSNEAQAIFNNKIFSISAIKVLHGPLPALAWRVDVSNHGSVTFSGDMSGQADTLPILAKNSSILVAHHAIAESTQGVGRFLHMPPSIIAVQAKKAAVKKLVLSHRMLRSLGQEKQSLEIINEVFKRKISFANDLSCYKIE